MNTIKSREQLISIQKQIKDGKVISEWTCRKPELYRTITVSEIGESWQSRMVSDNIQSFVIIDETLEYLMFPALLSEIEFMKYQRILDKYINNLLNLDIDGIYEYSIQMLIKIGYNV